MGSSNRLRRWTNTLALLSIACGGQVGSGEREHPAVTDSGAGSGAGLGQVDRGPGPGGAGGIGGQGTASARASDSGIAGVGGSDAELDAGMGHAGRASAHDAGADASVSGSAGGTGEVDSGSGVDPGSEVDSGSNTDPGTNADSGSDGAAGAPEDATVPDDPMDGSVPSLQVFATATGTTQIYPVWQMGPYPAPVGSDVQVTFFQTTSENMEIRRGMMEFAIANLPIDASLVKNATLVLKETGGMSMHPSFQFSVVAYDADLVITVQDHDRPAVLVTTLQADPWISGESWYVDVTETVKQRLENGANTGFRFQLTDEARTIETSTGTGFSIYAPFGSYLLIEVVSP